MCIGDIFREGEALLAGDQPRMPCAKLAGKHGEPQLVKWVADANYTAVLHAGADRGPCRTRRPLELVQPHAERISIVAVNDIIFDRGVDRALMERLVEMPEFGESGRRIFARRLAKLAEQR